MSMDTIEKVTLFLALALAAAPAGAGAQETIYDATGRRVGIVPPGSAGPGAHPRPVLLPGGEALDGERIVRYGAGVYVVGGGPDAPGPDGVRAPGNAFPGAGAPTMVNLFKDGTLEYLPLVEWVLGDIETGDVNGDGRDDIVFSVRWNDCDSIPGTKPRVWIQNSAGRFVDETDARIPDVTTSTTDLDLFDADGDGDLDILVCGYRCIPIYSIGTILINDGAGVFTDETADRLIGVPEFTVLTYAAEALIDSGDSPDIATILYDWRRKIRYPYLFLNTGDGHFWPDSYGRLLDFREYGFYDVAARDLTGDGLADLLFLNIPSPDSGWPGGLALFRNAGNGFFTDETVARLGQDTVRSVRDVAIGDADLDGDTDILDVGWFDPANVPQVRLLTNDGTGVFPAGGHGDIDSLEGWFNDAEFAPLVSDSLPDIFIAKIVLLGYSEDVLLLNRGGGVFRDSSELLPSGIDFTVAVSVFDYDRDGDFDIAIGNKSPELDQAGQNRLYINQVRTPPSGAEAEPGLPAGARLIGNYPNPFNPSTVIRYSLDGAAEVSIEVTNVLGEVVMRAAPGRQPAGTHELRWDAARLPGGVYWYSLSAGGRRIGTLPALLVR
jgi:hypothetical protein